MTIKRHPDIAMPDIPHTWREYNRQKGPVPLVAICLALGLIAAFGFFFLPVAFDALARLGSY